MTALGFVAAMLAARSALADHYVVPSGSMIPTVHAGDRIIAYKAAYGLRLPWTALWLDGPRSPERGDVVVLRSPETGEVLLKRVVAVAGDEVQVRHGRLWLNGVEATLAASGFERLGGETHAVELDHGGGPPFGPERVPDGHLLVMGDNRGNSHDGRSFGFVSVDSVLGQAMAVFFRDGTLGWREL